MIGEVFEGLSEGQLAGALEALLFVTDEPVGTLTLAEMVECDSADVEAALVALRNRLEREGSGVRLVEVAGGWRLMTAPDFHELIERYVLSWDTRKLSAAAMETLAIVAYTQPTTRAGVASVRGVSSDSSLGSLVEKGLVREVGVADAPGNPTLYGTTRGFLERFGLKSVKQLPDIADFAPDEETRRLITERLSAAHVDAPMSDEQAQMLAEELAYGIDEFAEGLSAQEADLRGAAAEAGVDQLAADSLAAALGKRTDDTIVAEGAAERAYDDLPEPRPSDSMFARAIASTLGVVDKIDFDSLTFETDDE